MSIIAKCSGKDLFSNFINIHHLSDAKEYVFQTAFFSFNAFNEYYDGLESAISNNCSIKFLFWERKNDDTIRFIMDAKNNVKTNVFLEKLSIKRIRKLRDWIIADKIKFKVIKMHNSGIFHIKSGYIIKNNKKTSFSFIGSINHTFNGININDEEVLIKEFEEKDKFDFEDNWLANNERKIAMDISENLIKIIDEYEKEYEKKILKDNSISKYE